MVKKRKVKVFLDTSALIAGIVLSKGSAREALRLAETGLIDIFVSRQVVVEADRNIEAKLPELIKEYRAFMKIFEPVLIDDPSVKEIKKFLRFINPGDAPILAAAVSSGADYLITWDKRHFITPKIKSYAGLKIVTPGDFLKEFLENIEELE